MVLLGPIDTGVSTWWSITFLGWGTINSLTDGPNSARPGARFDTFGREFGKSNSAEGAGLGLRLGICHGLKRTDILLVSTLFVSLDSIRHYHPNGT